MQIKVNTLCSYCGGSGWVNDLGFMRGITFPKRPCPYCNEWGGVTKDVQFTTYGDVEFEKDSLKKFLNKTLLKMGDEILSEDEIAAIFDARRLVRKTIANVVNKRKNDGSYSDAMLDIEQNRLALINSRLSEVINRCADNNDNN